MKTEAQIREAIKDTQDTLRQTQKEFELYDNHDDMEAIKYLAVRIGTLQWVLNKVSE